MRVIGLEQRASHEAAFSSERAAERFFDIWRQMRRGRIVRHLYHVFQDGIEPALSNSEVDVIQALGDHPEGCGMTELTGILAADAGNLTRTIAKLITKGCVTRIWDRRDARERCISLTLKGVTLAARQRDLRATLFRQATAHLSADRCGQLLTDLEAALALLNTAALPSTRTTDANGLPPERLNSGRSRGWPSAPFLTAEP